MVDETLGWEEHIAEFALHRDGMFEHSLIYLDVVHFLSELLIPIFKLCNRL